MQKFLDQLNDNLIYLSEELDGNNITIKCTVEKLDYYIKDYKFRVLKDLNFGDKFITLNIKLPVYYADKIDKRKSFMHKLECCSPRARRTKRLDSFIIENIKESSAIGLERTIKKTVCNVSDSSIIRLLKKNDIPLPNMKQPQE